MKLYQYVELYHFNGREYHHTIVVSDYWIINSVWAKEYRRRYIEKFKALPSTKKIIEDFITVNGATEVK